MAAGYRDGPVVRTCAAWVEWDIAGAEPSPHISSRRTAPPPGRSCASAAEPLQSTHRAGVLPHGGRRLVFVADRVIGACPAGGANAGEVGRLKSRLQLHAVRLRGHQTPYSTRIHAAATLFIADFSERLHSAPGAGRPRVTAFGTRRSADAGSEEDDAACAGQRAFHQLCEDSLRRAFNAGFERGVRHASPRSPRHGGCTGCEDGEPAERPPAPAPRKTSRQNASLIRMAAMVQSVPPAPAPRTSSRFFASSSTTSMPGMCLLPCKGMTTVPSLPPGVKRMGTAQLDLRKQTGRTEHSVRPVPFPI